MRLFEAALHEIDLPRSWLDAERAARGMALEFPPLAAVGALYTMGATGKVNGIVPLGLTTSARQLEYLRASVARLGLLPDVAAPTGTAKGILSLGLSKSALAPRPSLTSARHPRSSVDAAAPTSAIEAIETFAIYDARTRDFALTRAADGYAAWGDVPVAMALIRRALEIGQPGGRFVTSFIEDLPLLIDQRVALGDARTASNYRLLARLVADLDLAQWASIGQLRRRLADAPIHGSGEDFGHQRPAS